MLRAHPFFEIIKPNLVLLLHLRIVTSLLMKTLKNNSTYLILEAISDDEIVSTTYGGLNRYLLH